MPQQEREQPLLTIAIPTYNGALTIRSALDLLLPQCTDEVELLISDNVSTDETADIVAGYREKYPFLRYVRNETNIGPDGNFLQCLRIARGRFVQLLSDDDVLAEGALANILGFLRANSDVSLAYMNLMRFYERYDGPEACVQVGKRIEENILTADKKMFMEYAGSTVTLVSSIIYSKERFDRIERPERYFGTNWLQTYIAFECMKRPDAKLGLIRYPSIGFGSYSLAHRFDAGKIFVVNFRRLLDFAVREAGFDKRQMDRIYAREMICDTVLKFVVKAKADPECYMLPGFRTAFRHTWKYPVVWLRFYPVYLVPDFVCRTVMGRFRKSHYRQSSVRVDDR